MAAGRTWASAAEIAFCALLGPTWAGLLVGLWQVDPGAYRLDFYAEVGPIVWVALGVGLATSMALVTASTRLTRLAYANLAALFLVATAMPALVGYYSYGRADSLTIIGSIGGTTRRGDVRPENLYPATDYLGASIGYATGVEPHVAFHLMALATSALLLAVLCLLVRTALPGRRPAIAYLAAFVVYFGWVQATGIPNFVALGLVGVFLLLAVALPQRAMARLVAMLFLAIPVVLGHPFAAVFMVVALAALALFNPRGNKVDIVLAGSLVLLALLAWTFANEGIANAIARSYERFTGSDSLPVAGEATAKADRAQLSVFEWTQFLFLYVGRFLLPMAAIALAWAMTRHRAWMDSQSRWAWVLLAAGIATQLALLFNPVVTHSIVRVVNVNYMVFGLVPLFGVALALMARASSAATVAAYGLAFAVSCVSILGAFDSTQTFRPNQEFGREEVVAARWITTERGPYAIYNPLSGFEKRAMTLLYDIPRKDNPLRPLHEGKMPDHFEDLSSPQPGYSVIPEAERVLYIELYPEVGRFTQADFDSLEVRLDQARVYDSMGIRVYFYTPAVRR